MVKSGGDILNCSMFHSPSWIASKLQWPLAPKSGYLVHLHPLLGCLKFLNAKLLLGSWIVLTRLPYKYTAAGWQLTGSN